MKRNQTTSTALTVLAVLLLSVLSYGQSSAIKNLEMGIKSDNAGLQKQSVYYAGKYEIKEVIPALMTALENTKDAGTRKLIVRTLYKIDPAKALKSINNLTAADEQVKKLCDALNYDYNVNVSTVAAR